MLNVLFLCTDSSMRSIVAEAILRGSGGGRFRGFSAGCSPVPALDREVVEFLRERHLPVDGLRPRSWTEFTRPDAPQLAFVIALSAPAAALADEQLWPGDPVVAHWNLDADDPEVERSVWEIRDTFWVLSRRIKIFTSLPHGKTSRHTLERRLHALEAWQ